MSVTATGSAVKNATVEALKLIHRSGKRMPYLINALGIDEMIFVTFVSVEGLVVISVVKHFA